MKATKLLRPLFTTFVALFGTNLIDYKTGQWIAKAIVIPWKGNIYFFGYEGRDQVIPQFLPQTKISFWKRKMGFTIHPAPDFPNESQPKSLP